MKTNARAAQNRLDAEVCQSTARSQTFSCLLRAAAIVVLGHVSGAPGQAEGLDWRRFEVAGRPAFMIMPEAARRREPLPWVLYAPTFDRALPAEAAEGWMIRHFLDAGIAVAGVDVGESFGSPQGRATYGALHKHLTTVADPKFATRACLLARSRGGLMLYNWAADNPEKVAAIAGIYPVCDLRSYPGLARACGAYGLTEVELAESLLEHNPVDRLAPLAQAKIPIFHIHGDVDRVVPLESNSAAVAERYRKLGGAMELIVPQGQGHNMWSGFFHSEALVAFVLDHAAPATRRLPPPIARWRLDELEGEVAHDSVGGHHGTYVGTERVSGLRADARLFDRPRGDHIAIPHSRDFELSTFTVAAWVKLTRPPTFSGILGTRFGGEHTFDMKVNAAKVHGDIGDGQKWIETQVNFDADDVGSNGQGGKLAVGRWHHIAYVVDGVERQCRLYLDADLKKTIPFVGHPLLMQAGQEMRIGNSSSDEFMDGVIDDVCIWKVALSSEQIQTARQPPPLGLAPRQPNAEGADVRGPKQSENTRS